MDYIPDESAINVENIEVSLMVLSEDIWLAVWPALLSFVTGQRWLRTHACARQQLHLSMNMVM